LRRAALVVVLSLAALPAAAHQASMSWSQVTVGDDGTVTYLLRLSSRDLYEALGLERDRDATDAEIAVGAARLSAYVLARLHIGGNHSPCPTDAGGVSVLHQTDRFAEVRLVARCPTPLATLTIDYALFFDLDPKHGAMLSVTHAGATVTDELIRARPRFTWTLASSAHPSLGLGDFIVHGMEHIYTGYDHIAFVIGLLLVVPLRRDERPWATTLKVVTAFTAAHSLTLILAALEVISLPSRFVESAIAASIVFVAAENMLLPEPRGRTLLAFGFGLVHGLGFAAMLRPLLPETRLVVPLLAFNVGVEIGQLTIVLPVLPALVVAFRRAPARYRRVAVLGGSAVIGGLGVWWLIERVAGWG
jgi:hypothetical protein